MCGRAEAPRREDGQRRRGGFGLGGARFGQDGLARHTLLQQQLGRLDPRVGVEPRDERVPPDDIGERDERHTLVMREVRAHGHGPLLRRGRRVRFDIAISRGVVERLVEPVASVKAGLGERLEVLRRGRRRHEARQGGGVRRDNEIRRQAALQAKARYAEGAILVVALAIDEGIRRFRNAPGHATLPAVLDLAAHARAAALIEQCAREAAHEQLRHQVLEHRAAPRHQRGASIDVGHQPTKVEPVVLRDVTLGDRHEAGEARLRGEEVVEGAIEPSGTAGILQAVADGENPAPAVVQKIEAHAVSHCRHARRQRPGRCGR